MTNVRAAVRANLVVIHQGIRVLSALGAERYTARLPLCFNSSIGGHVRHIIEHYQSFLDGAADCGIDYEKRARDPLIESDLAHASGLLVGLVEELDAFGAQAMADRGVRVAAETSLDEAAAGSSLLRELEFLLSHTVHHFALVAIMARLQGCEPEPTFGVAPSTLKYEQSRAAACAP